MDAGRFARVRATAKLGLGKVDRCPDGRVQRVAANFVSGEGGGDLLAGFQDSFLARGISAVSEQGGGDGGAGSKDARRTGDAPVNLFAAFLTFVAGALALVWAWEWDDPEWLAIPGWLAAVFGGTGVLIAAIPWLWRMTV